MRRILFSWHGIDVYSYPFMLYIGLVFGVAAGNFAANLARLDSARVFIATLLLLVPALAGARLLFVAGHREIYARGALGFWRRFGGAAMYGGLLLALPISVPLLQMLQLPFGAFWDVATITILIGMIFTRVGCLLNGCCAGRPARGRFSLFLPDQHGVWKRRIPTQLLEAGWALQLLAGAIAIWSRLRFPGALFIYALGGYATGRLVLESMREREKDRAAFGLQHALSAGLVAACLVALFAER
jgi:phosphatidylglycerol---prolipoprotein diacylglyceryl transferase